MITVNEDTLDESGETVVITMGTPVNATAEGITVHTVTITDNDPTPSVTLELSATRIKEDEDEVATLTATLSALSGQDVTVDLEFTGTAGQEDYTADTSIVIPAGSISNTVTISGNSDTTDEPDELVITDISSVTNGTEETSQQVILIISDNNITPTISFTTASQAADENGGRCIRDSRIVRHISR